MNAKNLDVILGALAKFRKATISSVILACLFVCLFVRLPVHMEQLGFHSTVFL